MSQDEKLINRNHANGKSTDNKTSDCGPATFSLADYDCIGFDLDNTLAKYKLVSMFKLVHDHVKWYCVERLNFHEDLYKNSYNPGRFQKGLMYDKINGNVIKLNGQKQVTHAVHGQHVLTAEELDETYGKERHWSPTEQLEDIFRLGYAESDPLTIFRDYFGTANAQVCADIVDCIDKNGPPAPCDPKDKYDIWPQMYAAIHDLYRRKSFRQSSSAFFKAIRENPAHFLYECSAEVKNFLTKLRSSGKILFLVTSSHSDFAEHLANFCLGKEWRLHFDAMLTFARKPTFWTCDRHFLTLNADHIEEHAIEAADLQKGHIYSQGNWPAFKMFLDKLAGKQFSKVLYLGDSTTDDIYVPARYCGLDTIAIVEEADEHERPELNSTNLHGPFFSSGPQTATDPSLFFHMIATRAKLVIPSMEEFTKLPVDPNEPRIPCFGGSNPLDAGFYPPGRHPPTIKNIKLLQT